MSRWDKLKEMLKKRRKKEEIDIERLERVLRRYRIEEKPALKTVLERGVKVSVAPEKELKLVESPVVKRLAQFYDALKKPLSFFKNILDKTFGSKLEADLLEANMPYTLDQYLVLMTSAIFISWLSTLAILLILLFSNIISLPVFLFLAIIEPIFAFFIALLYPSNKAKKLANEIDKNLPFALRHMSIEIRAGVSIYKSMESIAHSDYGPVSEGFRWVLANIDKGVPTEEALEKWSERTRSEGLRRAIAHIVRAIRTGGNLSDVMVTIAEDVAFEHRMKIADFAEKLNLMGLFLMFVTVVFPVMTTILTVIGSTPTIQRYLPLFTLFSPTFLMIVYFVIVPSFILLFLYYIKSADPG